MKFIHCADLHLESKIDSIPSAKAKVRREELLRTFEKLCDYASTSNVSAVIIAGDMFDTSRVSAKTQARVLYAIENCKDVDFLYLSGNHDEDSFITSIDVLPNNLKVFGNDWTTFSYGDVKITGVNFDGYNNALIYDTLKLNENDVNIVVLHGQITGYNSTDKTDVITLPALKNKNIDYLALGHVHFYDKNPLDDRAEYCYSGCLDGRGFDELGDHGFSLVEVDGKTVKSEFVKFCSRRFHEYEYDVSNAKTFYDMRSEILSGLLKTCNPEDLVKVVLKGEHDADFDVDKDLLASYLAENFFFVKVYDKTDLKIDINDYALDKSVRGEFVRAVWESNLPIEEKKKIIMCGLNALKGEDVQ